MKQNTIFFLGAPPYKKESKLVAHIIEICQDHFWMTFWIYFVIVYSGVKAYNVFFSLVIS